MGVPSRRATGAALAAALLLAGAGDGRAEDDLFVSATDKLDWRRLDDGSRREEAFRNRLEVSAYRGIFGAWVRLESLGISDANVYDPFGAGVDGVSGEQRIDGTEVTRRLFTIDHDRFRAAVGDFSWVFGRGLALSVFEDEELNFDSRLEGVLGTYRDDRGSLTALGGSRDGNRFRGLFAEPTAFGPLRVGASFVEAWGGTFDTDIRDREQHAGGLAEVTAGPASVYGEYVKRTIPGRNGTGAERAGYGAFLSGVLSGGGFTLSGEWRDYERFEHEFHDPPTTLRQHTWTLLNRVNGQVLSDFDDDDVQGWLGEGEWSRDFFTSVRGSFGRAEPHEGDDDYWEAYGEAKTTWRERVHVTGAGAESEFTFLTRFEERISGFGELIVELDETNSLTLHAEWSEVQESDASTAAFEEPIEYRERIVSLSWGRSPWLTLTGILEDSTDDRESDDQWLTVQAEIVLNDNQDLTVSLGRERGGWKCSGGVCFFEPEFEGLKVRWVARY